MHLESDDFLEGIDALGDTLAAARATIEQLAASNLSFRAQVRMQRASTERARAWLRAHVDATPLPAVPQAPTALPPREDATDELLLRALGGAAPAAAPPLLAFDEPSGDEPFDAADPLADLDLSEPLDLDPLAHLDLSEPIDDAAAADAPHAADDAPFDPDALIQFDDDAAPFDDDAAPFDEDEAGSDGEPLLQFDDDASSADGPSPVGEEPLISFDDDLEDPDDPDSIRTPRPPPERAASPLPPPPPPPSADQTLVADLESLVQLQDLLAEEDDLGEGSGGTPQSAPPRTAATLTAEDLGRLGFTSGADLVDPSGADADPASETGSRPTPRLTSDEPSRPRVATARASGAPAYGPPDAALPTIRDSQTRPDARPAVAAIRLDPKGGASVVNEPITLELGAADDDWEDDGSGFSIQVEEYEAELEPLDEAELAPMTPTPPQAVVAAPTRSAPTMTGGQIASLLTKAGEAAERGDLQSAIQLYSDALDFDPDNVAAAVGRGLAWLDLADYARAMSDFTVAEDAAPNDPNVNAAIGKLYYDRKDYGRAIDYLDRAVELDPKHAMAWCRRGISHYYRKDYARAYNNLVEAEKLDPKIPNIRTYIGMVRKKMK